MYVCMYVCMFFWKNMNNTSSSFNNQKQIFNPLFSVIYKKWHYNLTSVCTCFSRATPHTTVSQTVACTTSGMPTTVYWYMALISNRITKEDTNYKNTWYIIHTYLLILLAKYNSSLLSASLHIVSFFIKKNRGTLKLWNFVQWYASKNKWCSHKYFRSQLGS